MSEAHYIIEIAVSDFATAQAAANGGADRIELCANLAEGGTTPSYGTILQCRKKISVPLYPIIRPRGGDFLYSDDEFAIMLSDIIFCKQAGCDGIVTGLLLTDGSIDKKRTALLIEAAYPLGVSFHRAFDRCRDPFEALELLISIGCERILTSGQRATAPEGADLIAKLQQAAAERIVVMPGSGVRKDNIRQLADYTGCTEFHSSLRNRKKSEMEFWHPAFADTEDSYTNNWINEDEVRLLKMI